MQHFLKDCFTRRILPFFLFLWWTTPDCVHFHPCTLNSHQFYMTWNHLTMSKNNFTASIELWLVSNSSYRQDRIKEKKNCTFFKILRGKNFKIVCRNKVLLVFKNVQNLFFTPKFLLSFFRLMSLVSHHAAFLERLFYKKNSVLFLVSVGNYSQLCSFRPMHTQFRSILHDLKSFDYVQKQFYCLHRMVVGLKFKLSTRQNKENQKRHIF